ncbi:presequence protease, mitochondrial [Culex quinquefasciatus]|uniref:Presequence protease, mitochondrial n=1 Tax=Culex quinquefasciatus TaxID=7176 RepID=B0WCZ9_CULQU|nr:presequence protease, mitochondrial [Culex quinquefasciatus]|eukprot:XP_001846583.1 presequence protease, mitochondrial [Culex quinquefasciatus]
MLRQSTSTRRLLQLALGRRTHSTISQPKISPAVLNSTRALDRYRPGERYNGFVCTRTEYIADFNMTAFLFRHEGTGLEYLHIDRNDSNNVFSVNFRTTPFDSTGLPHILEHSVLCGSERFPVRDPFFKMLNRSLATFMNAMTGPDYTLYPFSSTNEIDYRNLQSIYLDAVFRPNLKYLDFLQEGWRLEHSNLSDKNSELVFKGVVYNEMKGAFSENSAVFGQKFFNKILPDHTYGYVSGGDPLDIPSLTHEDLVNFHKKYYHPSNARIFSYGNFNLDKTMGYVHEQYLSQFDRIDPSYSVIPAQKRWTKALRSHIQSRFDNMGAPIERQNQIAIGYLMTDITDVYESFLMYIMSELLVKGPNSYFYKSLIEPNISGGYNQLTGFDPNIRDTMFVVGLQDLATDDFDKVQKIFDQTIDQVIEKGFDRTHLESVLHHIELHMKHQTTKFGLGLLFNLTPLWNHNGDLLKSLNVSALVQELRDNLARDPKYLQNKVEFYFRNNKHRLTMTMSPDELYDKKFNDSERQNLSEKVVKLNDGDRERILKEGQALLESQKAVPNTEVLPCLKFDEIRKTSQTSDIETQEFSGIPTQVCRVDTNGVSYFRGILDAAVLSDEQKLLIPLFNSVINQFGTKQINYREFDQLTSSKTAGIHFSTHLVENIEDFGKYEFGVLFGSYALNQNVPEMFKIMQQIFTEIDLTDVGRFQMLLENYMSELSVGIAQSGHLYAMQNANGLVTESGRLKEQLMGIEHIAFMKELTKQNTPEQILAKIRAVAEALFGKASLRSADSSKQSQRDPRALHQHIQPTGSLIPPHRHEHPSQLLRQIARTVPYSHPDYAPLKVLSRYLSSKYLLPVVREQNGAYGAGAKLASDGLFNFFSYRDPNSRLTLETFDRAYQWTADTPMDEQTLFEAKLGVLQQLDVPVAPIDRGMDQFRQGISEQRFDRHREEVLAVGKERLGEVSERYLKPGAVEVVGRSVLGPENEGLRKEGEKWSVFAL